MSSRPTVEFDLKDFPQVEVGQVYSLKGTLKDGTPFQDRYECVARDEVLGRALLAQDGTWRTSFSRWLRDEIEWVPWWQLPGALEGEVQSAKKKR